MKDYDKFTQLLLQDNIQKEKKWDNRFILDKIPQYDAFKDPNYLSLNLMKSKNKLEEKNNAKNNQKNAKKRIYSSHYSINSLTKKVPVQEKKNFEETFNNKNNQLNQKRPTSIYLNRNKIAFRNNINNSNLNSESNGGQKIFSNFIANKLKTQNNININTNNNDLNSFNDIFISKTTKNNEIKNRQEFIKYIDNYYNNLENNSVINQNNDLLKELNNIKEIWKEIYVSQEYQNSFEEMIYNLDKEEEIKNLLNYEKKQIVQFKNELIKLLKAISKREKAIENIKKLDKSFIENKRLEKFNKKVVEKYKSDSNLNTNEENIYKNGDLEEKNKKLIENDINNCLKLLRINSVNVIHQFDKFRSVNNHLITSGKIDINKLKINFGYNPDYLIKMKTDLDFLIYCNINLIYNFKTSDPFLLSLIPIDGEKTGNLKKIHASKELLSTINNYLYILTQEELLYKMKFKKDIKRNKSSGEYMAHTDEINFKLNNNNNNNKVKNINILKLKNTNEYKKIFFKHNKNSDLNMEMNIKDNALYKNGNRTKKIKNLYFNNQINKKKKDKKSIEELYEIPATSAIQLQKKFDYYNKLKQDLNNDKKENLKNDNIENKNENKKENIEKDKDNNNKDNNMNKNENKKENEENDKDNDNQDNNMNKNEDKKDNQENDKDNNKQDNNNKFKFNYTWFQDSFNKFKNIYNEYYNKLSQKTIEIFSLNKNVDELIYGINPKILICQKEEEINNKIYGICAISYFYEKNKLILKINHISSLEKDDNEENDSFYQKEKMEFKIYDHFVELVKSLPYQILELNLFIKEQNKEFLDYFINNYKFELQNENKSENNNKEEPEEKINQNNNEENNENKNNTEKKILRIYNIDDENLKKLIESNEIQYNNTSILTLVEDNGDIEQENNVQKMNPNKYFYKYINTFNLNILINLLSKDNIYNITNSSNEKISLLPEDFSKYSSLFIKDQNNNSDNIINISSDNSLIETKDKIKYAYITSLLNIKLFPFISTVYNKIPYNIFKINIQTANKDKNIYIINSSDEKISIYIYQCENENELKKEIDQSVSENFNIFESFNKLISKKNENEKDKSVDGYNFDEQKLLWVPSFSIDTELVCDKIPVLKDIMVKNNEGKKLEIKEYTEIFKIKYGIEELNNKDFKYEPNLKEDIIIEKDFIFAISHKDIKNQFNNSIVFLAYVTKENFIHTN